MLLLQVASLVVGISLLTVSPPRLVEAVVPGQDSVLLGAGKSIMYRLVGKLASCSHV